MGQQEHTMVGDTAAVAVERPVYFLRLLLLVASSVFVDVLGLSSGSVREMSSSRILDGPQQQQLLLPGVAMIVHIAVCSLLHAMESSLLTASMRSSGEAPSQMDMPLILPSGESILHLDCAKHESSTSISIASNKVE